MAIHAGAIEGLSTKISAMINNTTMKNSKDNAVILKNISTEAFQAFTEFGYTGDFSDVKKDHHSTNQMKRNADEANLGQEDTPCKKQFVKMESELGDTSSESVESIDQDQSSTSTSPSTGAQTTIDPSNSTAQFPQFKRLRSSLANRFKALDYGHSCSDSIPFLTILVELYDFATEYSMEALRQKALSSAHAGLCGCFNNVPHAAVVSYVKFMYSNGLKDESGGKCQLRELCVRYAVAQAGILHRSQPFEELLKSNGEFAVDFVRALAE